MKAIWNNVVVADSDDTIEVNGEQYFPPNTVKHDYLERSNAQPVGHQQNHPTYYHVQVNGRVELDAAWSYSEPPEGNSDIRGYFAFGRGVTLKD
ncbi:DUF427 domain-containing protein [Pontibacter actiniarum]|uniref:DUF427 domain-containing protein n=1 Tax=Pontibacter actiniarum TaxID=323450 RepID=A0A1X9YMA2_9BACT|nr:DUF427 domain-containing protein [Pontibacter actiniarum]ARS34000.1 hypothetical protein CA264_00295 [Pontibacter actiniarum]